MFVVEEVLVYHDQAIDLFGGSKGLRDYGSLDSALKRAWQTFASEDLYPSCFEKAAAVLESIILNHPFIDGNKRTGFILCEALLETNGYTITAETDNIYDFVVAVASGQIAFEAIVQWLKENSKPLQEQ